MKPVNSILSFLKTAWPIITLLVSLWSGIHASAAHADAKNGLPQATSIEAQGVNVVGIGGLSAASLLATVWGFARNHVTLSVAPSVAPPGVDEILHRYDEAHTALMADPLAVDEDFDGLNTLIKSRKARNKAKPKVVES